MVIVVLILKNIYIVFMSKYVRLWWVYVHHVCVSVLELKLPVASCLTWLLETEPESSTRAVSTLNHWAVTLTSTAVLSLVSLLLFLKVYFIHVQYMCIYLCVTCTQHMHVCRYSEARRGHGALELELRSVVSLWNSGLLQRAADTLNHWAVSSFCQAVRLLNQDLSSNLTAV